jgi:hypothetical protein
MPETVPSAFQRLVLAVYAFFAILFRAEVAAAVLRLREARRAGRVEPPESAPARAIPAPAPAAAPAPASPVPANPVSADPASAAPAARAAPAAPDPRSALLLLSVLQREGRLVDFLEEDLTGFPDAAVGAAARTVHAGCKRALEELLGLEPVLREPEGAQVTIQRGFDPSEVRLTGNVVGEPPFRGALRHHGWRVREVRLPRAAGGEDGRVVAPAEVEL